jgi:predicted regulator of Ras-like GTPase activity (Roadblock/LC7/MglB family)
MAMSFREQIERVVREVPGCVSCTLLGFDGITVDSVENPEYANESRAADSVIEYTSLLGQIRVAAQGLETGPVEEVCVRNSNMATLLRPINEEYLIAATFTHASYLGKGRYLLRVIAPKLKAELTL